MLVNKGTICVASQILELPVEVCLPWKPTHNESRWSNVDCVRGRRAQEQINKNLNTSYAARSLGRHSRCHKCEKHQAKSCTISAFC
jgi:hypothetical protein